MKLKAFKPFLKKLSNEEFKFISNKIEKARQDLSTIQHQLYTSYTDDLMEVEKRTLQNLERWSLLEESALKQNQELLG